MWISIIFFSFQFLKLLDAADLHVGVDKLYPTLTEAYNSANPGDIIYVFPGIYTEQLVIAKDNLTFRGSTFPSLNPSENNATLTHAASADDGSNDDSATLLVTASNFRLYNLNVENTFGQDVHAVAMSSTGSNNGFYACSFTSWQNTVYTHKGSEFFSRCYIEGAVDFIMGITGQAWFQGCTLGALKDKGWITAQGRTSSDSQGFFVFDKAKITIGTGAASATTAYLGRSWGDYARVILQNSDLGNVITAAGWDTMSDDQVTTNVLFAEYANKNGAGTRVSWAKKLISAESISSILGAAYTSWVDSGYLNLSAL
ncbi:carbohydrate esterase family 8 protein [Hyaloscypha variabilis]